MSWGKNQRYFSWQHRLEARRLALELIERGERVRVAIATNNGWHSYHSWLVVFWGRKIRHPMTVTEIVERTSEAAHYGQLAKAAQLFRAVRGEW